MIRFTIVLNIIFVNNIGWIFNIIFPGINLSKENLIKEASLLKNTQIAKTNKVVANNTQKSIQSGKIRDLTQFSTNGEM